MENQSKQQHKVRVFSTPTCPYCITLKAFLDDKGIEYQYIDVSQDEAARDEMVEKTGQRGVPVIEIDGQMIIGFDKEKISQLLGL